MNVKLADLVSDAGWESLDLLRDRLFSCIERMLAEDGHCKSYEGAFSVHFPNYFDSGVDESIVLTLDCYLVGPSRHYRWEGDNLVKAVESAAADINSWIGEENERIVEG